MRYLISVELEVENEIGTKQAENIFDDFIRVIKDNLKSDNVHFYCPRVVFLGKRMSKAKIDDVFDGVDDVLDCSEWMGKD